MLTRDTFLHKFMLNEKAKKKGYKDTLSHVYWSWYVEMPETHEEEHHIYAYSCKQFWFIYGIF